MRDPILATVIVGFVTFFGFGVISLIFGDINLSFVPMLLGIVGGIFSSFGVWSYYFSLSKEEVTRFIPIMSTSPLFVLLFAYIFLKEAFSSSIYLGIILLISGAILISVENFLSNFKIHKAILVSFGCAFLFALRNIFMKFALTGNEIWSIFLWIGFGSFIVSFSLLLIHHPHIRKKAELGIKHLIFVGIVGTIALFTFITAINIGPVSLTSALLELQPLFVFVGATILSIFHPEILKEKITKSIVIQKMIAVGLIVLGAVLLV